VRVTVTLALNGVDFTAPAAALSFTYEPPAVLESLLPASGGLQGGAVVTVTGRGLVRAGSRGSGVACKFGALQLVPAMAVNDTAIRYDDSYA
jgi:hypothetical protein